MLKMTRSFGDCALAAAAVATAVVLSATSAQAVNPEVVTINSSGTVFTPPARLDSAPAAAVANVILLTGGNGLLAIDASGYPQSSTGNFVIRSANEFMLRGMNVMMGDVAPALPTGISYTGRLNGTHKAMIQTFINAANARWPGKPTWLVGTSNGSVSIVAALGDVTPVTGVAGGVMTSPVTTITNSQGQLDAANQAIFDADKARITKPSIVTLHYSDACVVSSPTGAVNLYNSIPAATKYLYGATGGHSVMVDVCGAFSWHGYAGVEAQTVETIVNLIRTVSGVSQPVATSIGAPAAAAKPLAAPAALSFATTAAR